MNNLGYEDSEQRAKLARHQSIFLEQVLPNEALSPGDYHRRFAEKVSVRQSRRDLKDLEGAGLVFREGGGAATLYRRTNRTLEKENRT